MTVIKNLGRHTEADICPISASIDAARLHEDVPGTRTNDTFLQATNDQESQMT
jgi:hypothetical protein